MTHVTSSTQNAQTKSENYRIRAAVPKDTAVLLELILDLARFEKLEQDVCATEELLERELFGPNPVAYAIIAESTNGTPAGFALYFFSFSTFLGRPGLYLEDLFVSPQHRGAGLGQKLLSALAQIAVARNCGRMEWAVLNWNQKAIDLYNRIGAKPLDEWTTYRLTGPALLQLAQQNTNAT